MKLKLQSIHLSSNIKKIIIEYQKGLQKHQVYNRNNLQYTLTNGIYQYNLEAEIHLPTKNVKLLFNSSSTSLGEIQINYQQHIISQQYTKPLTKTNDSNSSIHFSIEESLLDVDSTGISMRGQSAQKLYRSPSPTSELAQKLQDMDQKLSQKNNQQLRFENEKMKNVISLMSQNMNKLNQKYKQVVSELEAIKKGVNEQEQQNQLIQKLQQELWKAIEKNKGYENEIVRNKEVIDQMKQENERLKSHANQLYVKMEKSKGDEQEKMIIENAELEAQLESEKEKYEQLKEELVVQKEKIGLAMTAALDLGGPELVDAIQEQWTKHYEKQSI